MSKAKAHQTAPAKKTISTSALFKKPVGIEKQKHAGKAHQKPQHSLSLAFNNSIDHSKEHIKERVDSELSPILANFMTCLENDHARSLELAKQAFDQDKSITNPWDDIELDWESNDKSRSGKTTLGHRIKKLEKIVKAEEASIATDMKELEELNDMLDLAAQDVLGGHAYEQALTGELDWDLWDPLLEAANLIDGVNYDLEQEKANWAEVIEKTNAAAMNEMKDSEKELFLRHDKVQQSFYKLLRDDDYF